MDKILIVNGVVGNAYVTVALPDPTPGPPLIPSQFEPGGTFEVYEYKDEQLVRIAFATDVAKGLTLTLSLKSLDTLAFAIPFDRFTLGGSSLRELQRAWQNASGDTLDQAPYAKQALVRDHVYVTYSDSSRTRIFRVATLEQEEMSSLAGVAVDAAVELSDKLTQYRAGRSQFAGEVPSEVAERILDGYQSLYIHNRRFASDEPVRMTLANEIPNMSPVLNAQDDIDPSLPYETARVRQPLPYVVELVSAVPNEAALFSGLPHESVGPAGTPCELLPGLYGYCSFADLNPATAGFYSVVLADQPDITPRTMVQDTFRSAPINLLLSDYLVGEPLANVSRLFYGCIKATVSGRHTFLVNSSGGLRVYFRGQTIKDALYRNVAQYAQFQSDLVADRWYPFVIHHVVSDIVGLPSGPLKVDASNDFALLQLMWSSPGESEFTIIPAENISPQMHGGLFMVRFADNDGIVRYMQAYKRWDGKGIVLAYPSVSFFPPYITYDNDWPRGMQPGTLIEEVEFPIEALEREIYDWGTGWTRKPGPTFKDLPAQSAAKFQEKIRGY